MPITLRLLNVSHSLLWLSPLRSQARGGAGRLAASRWIEQVSLSQHLLLTAPIKDSGFCRLAIGSVALALLVGVQVSWDSTTQRVTEVISSTHDVSAIPHVIHMKAPHGNAGSRIVTSLVHSQVVRFACVAADIPGKLLPETSEEAVLPPVPIASTDAMTCGKSVLSLLEKHLCGDVPLRDFLHSRMPVEQCKFLLVFISADAHAANPMWSRIWPRLFVPAMALLATQWLGGKSAGSINWADARAQFQLEWVS